MQAAVANRAARNTKDSLIAESLVSDEPEDEHLLKTIVPAAPNALSFLRDSTLHAAAYLRYQVAAENQVLGEEARHERDERLMRKEIEAQQWQQQTTQLTEQALLATFGVVAAGIGMGATSAALERVAVSHSRRGSNGSDESAPESSVTAAVKQAEADLTKALQVTAAQATHAAAAALPFNVLNPTVDDDIYDLFTDGS